MSVVEANCVMAQMVIPSFTDEVKYFIMYKNHWWQRYKYLNDNFTRPMKFDSADAAKEFLKKEGIAYED